MSEIGAWTWNFSRLVFRLKFLGSLEHTQTSLDS